ncbi:MAG: histidine--tRNA ligase [Acidobacteriota bacterium]|nr:histidine--tRNA ligase [Acidobacteriota bacterium]
MSKTQPARGMRDFLPIEVRKRNYVIGIIKEVYESYGFEPLETPAVENLETLTGKYGEEGSQLIFKILKRGEKLDVNDKELADLALRYDLTVPLARVVANYKNDLPKFFKRYQIQPVWRADRPARGRFREFYQCDVDAIGSSSMIVEAELCAAGSEVLQRLGFDDFVIRVNHRAILYAMLEAVKIEEEKRTDALVALDKLDKIGDEGVLREFENRGIAKDSASKLLNLFGVLKNSDNSKILSALSEFVGENEAGQRGIKQISQILESANLESLKIDASLARGLSYYTGAIFEVNVPDLSGSIASGGRYDGLIGMFGKEEIPASGFSLGLERILLIMEERGMFPPEIETNSADVLITIWNEESISESLKLANELRKNGLRVLVYPEADKLGKQFKYASNINIPFVCVLGETELAENKVTLKNMQTGEQETVLRDEIAGKIKFE